jgi:tetratricopeptide (TPR) repeat protein
MDLEAGDAAPWCASDRRRCEAGAIDLARRAQAVATDRCEPYELEAKVMILAGDRDAAVTLLMKAADRVRDTAGCLRHAAEFAIEAQNDVLAQQAIERLANASCSTESECIELLLAAARLEDARGFGGRALILYKRAMDRAPDRDDLAELVATRAAAAGVKATAIDAYERLARRHPEEPRYRRALDELRASRR